MNSIEQDEAIRRLEKRVDELEGLVDDLKPKRPLTEREWAREQARQLYPELEQWKVET